MAVGMRREKFKEKSQKEAQKVSLKHCKVLEKELELLCGCGVTLAGPSPPGGLPAGAFEAQLARLAQRTRHRHIDS